MVMHIRGADGSQPTEMDYFMEIWRTRLGHKPLAKVVGFKLQV